jgi:hypothetical protein
MFAQGLCAVSNVSCTSNVSRALIQALYGRVRRSYDASTRRHRGHDSRESCSWSDHTLSDLRWMSDVLISDQA